MNLIAAELLKLRTLPAVVATAIGTAVAVAVLSRVADAEAMRYGQAGFILLGVLAAASEYSGRQIQTTLTSAPGRTSLAAAKIVAHLIAAALTAVVVVPFVDSSAHYVMISALAHAVALLVRDMVVALVVMLTLVFVAPPLLGMVTALARFLPDRGGAVLAAWVVLATAVATIAFVRRDA